MAISYRDRTYCGSATCKNDCGRKLTEEDRLSAKALGLPICYSHFCDGVLFLEVGDVEFKK